MKVFLSKYELKKSGTLNAKDSEGVRLGTLIKVVDTEDAWGVADLSPWPNLGDLKLDQELQQQGLLFQRAIHLAKQDLEGRRNKKSLLYDRWVENNFLIADFTSFDFKTQFQGVVKIKGKPEISKLHNFLNKFTLSSPEARLRIDFNESLSESQMDEFLKPLSEEVLKKIEYIEDPTPWSYSAWKNWNQKIPLAVDFVNFGDPFRFLDAWSVLIIKPTRQNTRDLIAKCRATKKTFTLTSAMDHPVGLAHGLRLAQELSENVSGFLTLNLYEEIGFNKFFETNGNKLNFSALALDDVGIGMTDKLNSLQWDRYEPSISF